MGVATALAGAAAAAGAAAPTNLDVNGPSKSLDSGAADNAAGAAAPANLGVNGLTESTGLGSASFPVDEGFVLTWEAPAGLLTGQHSDSSFVVDLTGTLAGGTPLTWSSGTTKSSDTMLALPSTLTSRFAPGATFAMFASMIALALDAAASHTHICGGHDRSHVLTHHTSVVPGAMLRQEL